MTNETEQELRKLHETLYIDTNSTIALRWSMIKLIEILLQEKEFEDLANSLEED